MTRSVWPDRQHFYAGLLCIPFVLWLAGDRVDLIQFKPQIDAYLDRPFANLTLQPEIGWPI